MWSSCPSTWECHIHTEYRRRLNIQWGPVVDELFRPLAAHHLVISPTSRHIAVLHFFVRPRQQLEHKISIGAVEGNRKTLGWFDIIDKVAMSDCGVVMEGS